MVLTLMSMQKVCIILLISFFQVMFPEVSSVIQLSGPALYTETSIRFRYAPPDGLQDETEVGRAQIKARASARHTSKTLKLLLSMSSGSDSTARNWRALTIETYPRQALSDLDDESAKAKVSAWVAQSSSLPAKPRNVILAGQNFAVFVFGVQNGATKKGAVIWTTIRNDKVLSFSFVANSPDQLKSLAESMKSVQFF